MSVQENKQVALTVIEALNTRDLSLWSKLLAEDYIQQAARFSEVRQESFKHHSFGGCAW